MASFDRYNNAHELYDALRSYQTVPQISPQVPCRGPGSNASTEVSLSFTGGHSNEDPADFLNLAAQLYATSGVPIHVKFEGFRFGVKETAPPVINEIPSRPTDADVQLIREKREHLWQTGQKALQDGSKFSLDRLQSEADAYSRFAYQFEDPLRESLLNDMDHALCLAHGSYYSKIGKHYEALACAKRASQICSDDGSLHELVRLCEERVRLYEKRKELEHRLWELEDYDDP